MYDPILKDSIIRYTMTTIAFATISIMSHSKSLMNITNNRMLESKNPGPMIKATTIGLQ